MSCCSFKVYEALWLIYVLIQVSNVHAEAAALLLSGIADNMEYSEDGQPLVCTGISGTPSFTEFCSKTAMLQFPCLQNVAPPCSL